MPPFVRAFAKLFIGFPGLLIWLYGCLLAVSSSASLMGGIARRLWLECLLMFLGGFVGAQIGHGMRVATGILTGDPKHRLLGGHLGERMAWDALVQVTGILFVAAGFSVLGSLGGLEWPRFVLSLCLLGSFGATLRYLVPKRRDLHSQWADEVVTRETERARMEFDARRMAETANPGKP